MKDENIKLYNTEYLQKRSTLVHESKYVKISEIQVTPTIESVNTEIDVERFSPNKYNEELLHFIIIMTENFPIENVKFFYKNLTNLKVKSQFLLSLIKSQGFYNCKKNMVVVDSKKAKKVIYHELLHMASSIVMNQYFTGFFQSITNNKRVGNGLNEGYTELLSHRYFNADNKAYTSHVLLASQLEKIIGKEKMEELYFKADLLGLINILRKYASDEEIEKFLFNMDYTLNFYKMNKKCTELDKILNYFNEIYKFLINCYARKLGKNINHSNDTEKLQAIKKLMEYACNFTPGYYFDNGQTALIMSEEQMIDYIMNAKNYIFANNIMIKKLS